MLAPPLPAHDDPDPGAHPETRDDPEAAAHPDSRSETHADGRPDAEAQPDGCPEAHPDAVQDRLDGLTVDLGNWWFNLRPSNTEPLLRLNLEARTRDECDTHTSELLHLITKG